MTQGNPFGQKGGKWMSTAQLRALFNAGLTYREIAAANKRTQGWAPSLAAVMNKRRELGIAERQSSHIDLIPWQLTPEDADGMPRHMLQAESRKRKRMGGFIPGSQPSPTDKKLLSRLHEILFEGDNLLVVDYNPSSGFSYVLREDSDDDLIRKPRDIRLLRSELVSAIRDQSDGELVETALDNGLLPELLENAGRDRAADLLRRRMPQAEPVVEADAQDNDGEASAPQPRRRRRRTASGE